MSNDRNVRKYLDVSTGHIPADERERIDGGPLVAHPHPDGWWVWVPPDDDPPYEHAELFPCVTRVLRIARELGCAWVCLDRDAGLIEGAPWFGNRET
jgi:hypothetical protein